MSEAAGTVVRFGRPGDAELEAYIATGEPLRSAGGFTIEGFCGPCIARIEGDPSNVLGLCVPLLRRMLASVGVPTYQLCSRSVEEGEGRAGAKL